MKTEDMYSSPPSVTSTESTCYPGSIMSSRRMVPVISNREFLLSAKSIVFTDLAQAVLAVCRRANALEPEKRVLYDIEVLGLRPYCLLDRVTRIEYPILGHGNMGDLPCAVRVVAVPSTM